MGPSRRTRPGAEILVLFDLDDTLFDHRHARARAMGALRARYRALRASSFDAALGAYDAALAEMHPRVLRGELTVARARELRLARVFEVAGRPPSPARLAEARRVWAAGYARHRRAVPGAAELLRELRRRRVRLGIVSNNWVAEQRRKLRATGLSHRIDDLTVSEEAGAAKPDPAIFRLALRRAGIRADRAVFVGDSWESDIVGARGAGLRPVWFRPGRSSGRREGVAILGALRPARRVADRILAELAP